ncbi:aspartate aminotransferase family protein [Limnochorda pilosa]|uniref:aspartate aminotransferase family protein n=1 Tax=Limnochorda pilosa TaxID=1555112 RepID=UPI0026F1EF7C|nr:aminotransferase class III-fold pyridoxal phosphate-dependent enzyme [Limnochorda pilosa]
MLAGGLTHDSHRLEPFPPYITKVQGAYKWDADGHRLVDYWMGHGAMILGYDHPKVVEAVERQLARGSFYGAEHPLALEWAERIQRMVPSAERVRFTVTGSEATELALRLARAATGRPWVVKFAGHYHGWHEPLAKGVLPGEASPGTDGRPAGDGPAATRLVAPDRLDELEALLDTRQVAAVILEPGGGSWGAIPVDVGWLQTVRELTHRTGTVLIFDEVITGFRLAPGGAQERYGVLPDLTCLAKIVSGGMPGAAVAGRAEIMAYLDFRDEAWNRSQRVAHLGTFNATPLAAAAGIATLDEIASGRVLPAIDRLGARLVQALNERLRARGVRGYAYGQASIFHIALGVDPPEGEEPSPSEWQALLEAAKGPATQWLRKAMLLEGVDLMRSGGFLSAAHGDQELEETVQAFDRALERLSKVEPAWFA